MANELTVTGTLAFAKSPVNQVLLSESGKTFDVAGTKYVRGVQNIGTAAEAINLGDVGTPGWFFIKNLDTANFVQILTAVAGNALMKLKPGEVAMGRFTVAAPAAQANVAPVNIEYLIIED